MAGLKKELVPLSIVVITLVIVLFYWTSLPNEIPMHLDFNGEFNNVARKETLFLILVPGYLLFFFVDLYAKNNNEDYENYATFLYIFRIAVVLVISLTTLFFVYNGLTPKG